MDGLLLDTEEAYTVAQKEVRCPCARGEGPTPCPTPVRRPTPCPAPAPPTGPAALLLLQPQKCHHASLTYSRPAQILKKYGKEFTWELKAKMMGKKVRRGRGDGAVA
jgi:hypothetical protein